MGVSSIRTSICISCLLCAGGPALPPLCYADNPDLRPPRLSRNLKGLGLLNNFERAYRWHRNATNALRDPLDINRSVPDPAGVRGPGGADPADEMDYYGMSEFLGNVRESGAGSFEMFDDISSTPDVSGPVPLSEKERAEFREQIVTGIRSGIRSANEWMAREIARLPRMGPQFGREMAPAGGMFDELDDHAEEIADDAIDNIVKGKGAPRAKFEKMMDERWDESETFSDELELWNLKHVSEGKRPLFWENQINHFGPDGLPLLDNSPAMAVRMWESEKTNEGEYAQVISFKAWIMDPECSPADPDVSGSRTCIIDSEKAKQKQPILDKAYVGSLGENKDQIMADMGEAAAPIEAKLGPRTDWLGRGRSWASHLRWAEADYLTRKQHLKEHRRVWKDARRRERIMEKMTEKILAERIKSTGAKSGSITLVSREPMRIEIKKWQDMPDAGGYGRYETEDEAREALRGHIEKLREKAAQHKAAGRYYLWAGIEDTIEDLERYLQGGSLAKSNSRRKSAADASPLQNRPPAPSRSATLEASNEFMKDSTRVGENRSVVMALSSTPVDTDLHPFHQRAIQWGIPFIPQDQAQKYGYLP